MPVTTPRITLLSLDFDGTIADWGKDPPVPDAFFEAIRNFHAGGGIFALNTGRTLAQIEDLMEIFPRDVLPQYLLLAERELHRAEADQPGVWEDVEDWNDACRRAHDELAYETEEALESFSRHLSLTSNVRIERQGQRIVGLVTETERQMDQLCQRLDRLRDKHPNLGYQRNYIYLRFCHVDYHKGAILRELARRLEIPHTQIFAAGDNLNDLEMMDPTIAGALACPGNAHPTIKDSVRQSGGFVARENAAEGLLEAFRHYGIGS